MKKFDFQLLGGILLIVGTSIGGGMLALPLSNAPTGFFYSTCLLIISWFVMIMGAFAILEVNLWLPSGSNLISMSHATLGNVGKTLTWFVYLFLLYALLCAYISGGSDIFQSLLHKISLYVPTPLSAILFVLIFGCIVYSGVRSVDYANRALMFGKFGVCFLLLILILPKISLPHLRHGSLGHASSTLMILIVSFGFANIVPSLRTYFHDDIKKLRKAIIIGSAIPLIIYILWDAAIMGVIPFNGPQGLFALLHSSHSTSDLSLSLTSITQNSWISSFFNFFSSICMLTAFLGVSLGLFDFLSDGLKIKKTGKTGILIFSLAYLPPLILVLFCPGIFIKALSYAGLIAVILLILIPALMLGMGRYIKKIPEKNLLANFKLDEKTNKFWKYESEELPSGTLHLSPEKPHAVYRIKHAKLLVSILILASLFLIFQEIL